MGGCQVCAVQKNWYDVSLQAPAPAPRGGCEEYLFPDEACSRSAREDRPSHGEFASPSKPIHFEAAAANLPVLGPNGQWLLPGIAPQDGIYFGTGRSGSVLSQANVSETIAAAAREYCQEQMRAADHDEQELPSSGFEATVTGNLSRMVEQPGVLAVANEVPLPEPDLQSPVAAGSRKEQSAAADVASTLEESNRAAATDTKEQVREDAATKDATIADDSLLEVPDVAVEDWPREVCSSKVNVQGSNCDAKAGLAFHVWPNQLKSTQAKRPPVAPAVQRIMPGGQETLAFCICDQDTRQESEFAAALLIHPSLQPQAVEKVDNRMVAAGVTTQLQPVASSCREAKSSSAHLDEPVLGTQKSALTELEQSGSPASCAPPPSAPLVDAPEVARSPVLADADPAVAVPAAAPAVLSTDRSRALTPCCAPCFKGLSQLSRTRGSAPPAHFPKR
mmetsp:Transcript_92711/g.153370  ORF Transcript_92711/g.153370 Transcript_92711/m.153370 type:complete len:449 (+) Transcript_92711:103-1449(+)